jgi:acyl carrier protein
MESNGPTPPALETLLASLAALGGLDYPISPTTPVAEVEVDSLSMLEWLFALEEEFGFVPPDEVFDNPEKVTFLELYDAMLTE